MIADSEKFLSTISRAHFPISASCVRSDSDKDLKKRVLKGERLLVSMDVCDCEMSESIELKLTIICVDE